MNRSSSSHRSQQAGDRGARTAPRLLVIDGSYSYESITALGLEQSVVTRDLDGYFDHVWTVYPFGEIAAAETDIGTARQYEMNPRHTFIQARFGKFRSLSKLPGLNFFIGQIALLRQLRRLIRRERIDLIRAGDPLYIGLLSWLLAKSCGIPLAIRVGAHNERTRQLTGVAMYPRILRSLALERAIEHFVFRRAALVVGPSQDNIDFAIAHGANPDRVAIFPYGNLLATEHQVEPARRSADPALFKRLGVEPEKYLLCVSRLRDLKYPDDAVRAFASECADRDDFRLLLAGEGEFRGPLEQLVADLGVTDRVIFASNLDQASLAQLYANAAVVVSPLTGRALCEAALGGAPIVAYDLDWQSDLIETGESGELVPFRDQHALGKAVARLLEDRAYARRMGEGARAKALAIFDPQALVENERMAYARILKPSA